MTVAKINFDSHINQCSEAISIHEFLESYGYTADFGLRFVWVASVSALDHYISELIVEKATEHYSNGNDMSARLLNELIPISALLQMQSAPAARAVLEFRNIVTRLVRFRTFQKAEDVSDGLSFVWNEKHKWDKISDEISMETKKAKSKLNSICNRRNLIAHNADYNEATGALMPCVRSDAQEVLKFVSGVVDAIDKLVP